MSIPVVLAACTAASGAQLADQFRELLSRGLVAVQGCGACGNVSFPPLLRCPRCGSADLAWWDAGPSGYPVSWVTVHTATSTETISIPRRLLDRVPYTTVIVELGRYPDTRMPFLLLDALEPAVGVALDLDVREVNGTWIAVCG